MILSKAQIDFKNLPERMKVKIRTTPLTQASTATAFKLATKSMFTDEFSLLGSKGNTVNCLRKDHNKMKKSYKKRKEYEVKYN